MFQLFYTLLDSGDNYPDITCQRQTGNIGIIGHYKQNDDNAVPELEDNYTSYYLSKNKGVYDWVAGSFCPKQTGKATLKLTSKPALYGMFDFKRMEAKYEKVFYCTIKYYNTFEQMFYANRCYPLAMAYWATNTPICSGELYAELNGTRMTSETVVLQDSYTQDCLPGYYTDTCEKKNDADCNGNGSPEYGRTSGGYGCVCDKFADNIFCEDTTKNRFENPGVKFESYYNKSRIDISTTLDDLSYTEFGESYATVEINSKLYVPQNTYLEFEFTTVPNAQLFINDEHVAGYLDDRFDCKEKKPLIYQIPKKWYTKGIYQIKIIMNSGCAMFPQGIGLKWKFHRLHKNNPQEFEDIPSRYLGIP